MRPRLALLVLALLAVAFAAGSYPSDWLGSSHATSTAQSAPSDAEPRERRPAFSIAQLPRRARARLRANGSWRRGCPVPMSDLRMLRVTYRGFDRRRHSGALVVNRRAARPLNRVFRRLHRIRFPIRHIGFWKSYGPRRARPREGDVTASFQCRQSVPSPCTGGRRSGRWSMHAYGLAIDINPRENPYVGCGRSYDPAAAPYRDRSRHRRGMVGRRVVAAFASIGWSWGGVWTGNTKDYMHFSATGR